MSTLTTGDYWLYVQTLEEQFRAANQMHRDAYNRWNRGDGTTAEMVAWWAREKEHWFTRWQKARMQL